MQRLRSLDLSLDLSLGTQALLAVPGLTRLEKLDIHHHYVSPEMVKRLQALGIVVEAGDPREEYDIGDDELYRYVAHSE
jgi:hypothetical protein